MEHYPSLAKNYAAPPFNAVKGQGIFLYDDQGNQYLDFTSGIKFLDTPTKWMGNSGTLNLVHCKSFGIPSQQNRR